MEAYADVGTASWPLAAARRPTLTAMLTPCCCVQANIDSNADPLCCCAQANIDSNADPSEWRLEALANKLVQYCVLLEGLTAEDLANNSKARPNAGGMRARPCVQMCVCT